MRDVEIFETDLQEIVADLEGEVFGETDEAAIEAGELDGEGELDQILAGAVRAAFRGCPPQAVNVDCPPSGARPSQVLDNFSFDKTDLSPTRHAPAIVDIARRIIASQSSRRATRSILIAGHTDPVGAVDYNFRLGWRRARAVMNQLCSTLERLRPGVTRSLKFHLTSCGERQPKATAEQSLRVELFLETPPASTRAIPHQESGMPTPYTTQLYERTMLGRPPASNKGLGLGSPVDSPVLDLIQIQRGTSSRPFTRKPTGFEAFFSDGFPSPQAEIAITGKLMMEKNGVRRAITAADLKKLQPEKIRNYVYPERGVRIAHNSVRKIKFDGSFTTNPLLH